MHLQIRDKEIKLLSKTAVVKTWNLCLVFAVPPVIALVIFATYVFNVGRFDSVFSFTVLSLFNTLRFPLVVLPKALRGTSGEFWRRDFSPHLVETLYPLPTIPSRKVCTVGFSMKSLGDRGLLDVSFIEAATCVC